MGACASCLRGRDKPAAADRGEREPLLSVGTDPDLDGAGEAGDQQYQQRQQALGHIVQTTHEYFIDVASVDRPEPAEPTQDVSELIQKLHSRMGNVELKVPHVKDLTAEEREQLENELRVN